LGEEVGLHERGLQARLAAVQVAEDEQLVRAAGLGGHDVHVPVEEGLLPREARHVGRAREAAAACSPSLAMTERISWRSAWDCVVKVAASLAYCHSARFRKGWSSSRGAR